MSVFDCPDTSNSGGWGAREIGDVEREVQTFLADKARSGSIFVKSSRVAKELDITPIRAGQAIALLERESAVLDIGRWSGENQTPTTWRVECFGPTPYGRECRACEILIPEDAETCPHCGQEVRR